MWKSLRLIPAILLATYVLQSSAQTYMEPPDDFLTSSVVTPFGMNNYPFGQFSVLEFTEILAKKQLDNGSFPELLGWTISDNVYTLHVLLKDKSFGFVFTHLLDQRSQGQHSYLEGGLRLLAAIMR